MTKRRKQPGICTYCGKNRLLTKDHIPPKNLFPEPRPDNLITVPCCQDCNKEAGKDDEYFRLAVVMRADAGQHHEARRVWQTVFGSLQRSEAKGLTRSLLASIRPVNMITTSGLYIDRRMGYKVDFERLNRVATRIVRGLFRYEKGHRLPETHVASTLIDSQLQFEEGVPVDLRKVVAALLNQPAKEIGNGVFSYRFLFTEDEPNSSAWLLGFYENLVVSLNCLDELSVVGREYPLGYRLPTQNRRFNE